MKLKIGPAISSKSYDPKELEDYLEEILEIQNDAIELSLTRPQKIRHVFTDKIYSLISKFDYISIHAPVRKTDGSAIKYPSKEGEKLLDILDKIIYSINPNTLLFHPDIVENFDYLSNKYPEILAYENMDSAKSFGKTIEDMYEIFQKAPNSKWVLDINHIYTNDKSMVLAKEFYTNFKDRLVHYHISSLGNFHDCFCLTHEDEILKGVLSFDKPLIHEGNAVEKGIFKEEINYIFQRLI